MIKFFSLVLLGFSLLSTGAVAGGTQVLIHGPEVDLTVADLKQALAAMPENVREQTLLVPSKLRKVMDQTYLTKVAAHRALAHGLDKEPGVIAKLRNYRRNVLAAAEVERSVAANLPSESGYLEAARELYQARQKRYLVPEQVRVRHILLKWKDSEDEAQLLERARQLRQKIVSGALDFQLAATQYSEDAASARKGGYLRPFSRGRMVKPFEEAAFALKEKGEISQPVKTRYGYHIIQLVERLPSRQIPFEEVRDKLAKEIRDKAEAEAKTDYWLEIRDDPAVGLNEPLIDKLLSEPEKTLGTGKQ